MVTRLMTQTLCGVCLKRDDVEQPITYTEEVRVGSTTRIVELCDPHKAEFMQLLVFLELYGETPEEQQDQVQASGYGCKFCEGVFSSPGRRAKHVREDHRGYAVLKSAQPISAVASVG
jgi:hypothetical protein